MTLLLEPAVILYSCGSMHIPLQFFFFPFFPFITIHLLCLAMSIRQLKMVLLNFPSKCRELFWTVSRTFFWKTLYWLNDINIWYIKLKIIIKEIFEKGFHKILLNDDIHCFFFLMKRKNCFIFVDDRGGNSTLLVLVYYLVYFWCTWVLPLWYSQGT